MRRDTTKQRDRDKQRLLRVMWRVFDPYASLWWYRVDLGLPNSMLHTDQAHEEAKRVAHRLFDPLPAHVTLHSRRRDEAGGLHIHVISPVPPHAIRELGEYAYHVQPVTNLGKLARYPAAPCDARLREADRRVWEKWKPDTYTRRREHDAAYLEWGDALRAARSVGRSRLSAKRFWVNLPRRSLCADRAIFLAVFLLTLSVPQVQNVSAHPVPLMGNPRHLPVAPVRSWRHVPTHPPPRRTQEQAR